MAKKTRPVLTAESIDIANRRVYELSGPNGMMTVTEYVNALVKVDGDMNPDPRAKRRAKK